MSKKAPLITIKIHLKYEDIQRKNIKEMEKVMFIGKSVALHIHIMRSLKSTIIFNLENQSEKNH